MMRERCVGIKKDFMMCYMSQKSSIDKYFLALAWTANFIIWKNYVLEKTSNSTM